MRRTIASLVAAALAVASLIVVTPSAAATGPISISDISMAERNCCGLTYIFTISQPNPVPSGCRVTIPWSTGGGTATPASDYTATAGTAIIGGGSRTSYAYVSVGPGDTTVEPDETFNVVLGTPTVSTGHGYPQCATPTVADGTAVGTIVNDDGPSPSPSASPSPSPSTPPPSPTPGPHPNFTKTPPEKVYACSRSAACRHRAAVTFAWITDMPPQHSRELVSDGSYICRLDERAFEPCSSPTKVRVKIGRHEFQVASVDAAGTPGPPASFKFRVVRKR